MTAHPASHRLVPRYFDDLPVRAVAEVMGTSPGTVRSRAAKDWPD